MKKNDRNWKQNREFSVHRCTVMLELLHGRVFQAILPGASLVVQSDGCRKEGPAKKMLPQTLLKKHKCTIKCDPQDIT